MTDATLAHFRNHLAANINKNSTNSRAQLNFLLQIRNAFIFRCSAYDPIIFSVVSENIFCVLLLLAIKSRVN